MHKKPVYHSTPGWDKACAVSCTVFAAFAFVAASNTSGGESFALNLLGVFAVVGAIHFGEGLGKVIGAAVHGFCRRLADAVLPAPRVYAIDQIYATLALEVSRGRTFAFVYSHVHRPH